jgi:hypothetical protein
MFQLPLSNYTHESSCSGCQCKSADEIKSIGRKVGGFEIINNAGFETENLLGKLTYEKEIKRRLEFLADRTLTTAAINRKSSHKKGKNFKHENEKSLRTW